MPTRATPLMRFARLATTAPTLDAALALATARPIGRPLRAWMSYHGAFPEDVDRALAAARGRDAWARAWLEISRDRIRFARAARERGHRESALAHTVGGAIAAQIAPYLEPWKLGLRERALRASATAYRSVVTLSRGRVRPLRVAWDGDSLPAFAHLPAGVAKPPVVVLLNAIHHYKEIWHGFATSLAARGVAAVTFDGPGEGEMWPSTIAPIETERVASAVLDRLAREPSVDASRAGVAGLSLAGTTAARAAATDARWRACAALSPAFDVRGYVNALPPFLRVELEQRTGLDRRGLRQAAPAISLAPIAHRIRAPLVVVRAGKDMLVPPEEAERLYDAASSERKRLLDFPGENHCGAEKLHESLDAVCDFLAESLQD